MAKTFVPSVKINGLSSERFSRAFGKRMITSPDQQVEVVIYKSPRVYLYRFGLAQVFQASQKIIAISFLGENVYSINPAPHHVVENARSV